MCFLDGRADYFARHSAKLDFIKVAFDLLASDWGEGGRGILKQFWYPENEYKIIAPIRSTWFHTLAQNLFGDPSQTLASREQVRMTLMAEMGKIFGTEPKIQSSPGYTFSTWNQPRTEGQVLSRRQGKASISDNFAISESKQLFRWQWGRSKAL